MSDGSWPADPTDPRCPECGEPVSATASYCMHCEADLPAANFGRSEPSAPAPDVPPAPGTTTGEPAAEEKGWLHPDSLLDDVSTGAVGVVGGLLVGIVATFELLFLVGGWGLPVGLVVWLGATGYVGWTRTVFGAARKAGYLLAGLVALLPLVLAVTPSMEDPSLAGRLVALVVTGIVAWPIALVLAGAGWLAGRSAVDDAERG